MKSLNIFSLFFFPPSLRFQGLGCLISLFRNIVFNCSINVSEFIIARLKKKKKKPKQLTSPDSHPAIYTLAFPGLQKMYLGS